MAYRSRVLETLLRRLERRRHVEYRSAVLNRDDPAVGKAAAVASPVDLVKNG
jgi:hypothetical protein